jgi:3-dehydroquinate synthase
LAQVRNGFAEIIKISSCADLATFNLLEAHCEELIETRFGRLDGSSPHIKEVADKICKEAIHVMLKLESPNLHEIGLDRVIAYGHTWSPLHELVPETPLRHGHAISIDMAYTATIGMELGLLSKEEHTKLLRLFSRAGLSIDHPDFNDQVLEKATAAILRTRDGLLRLATPGPLGSCTFINEYTLENLQRILALHKKISHGYPRSGDGIEAYVDASDTGEGNIEQIKNGIKNQVKQSIVEIKDQPATHVGNGYANGHSRNGLNGHASEGILINGNH